MRETKLILALPMEKELYCNNWTAETTVTRLGNQDFDRAGTLGFCQ
ncbi:hypothetical protein MiSe_30760 [Microseira wollei NIES-4236]|uniref:Uncharacterized protein n=1 Tax=Microseira wollei NIES-4236 TaxID=2530354 RepID=A0AAV3XDY6_9CYAN|nr:hypothetical protein MiSe_30760 [Microseira wollei NIES-4236]